MKRFPVLVIVTLLVAILQPIHAGWTRTYGGVEMEWGGKLLECPDGNYVVLGATASYEAGKGAIWLLKINEEGDTLWTRTYSGDSADSPAWFEETSDSGYIIVGNTRSFGAEDVDIWLIKTDRNGDTLWTKTYGGPEDQWATYVGQTLDGGYMIIGETESFGPCDDGNIWVIKTDSKGDTLITHFYGDTLYNDLDCANRSTPGHYVMVGAIWSVSDEYYSMIEIDWEGHEWSSYPYDPRGYTPTIITHVQLGHAGHVLSGGAYHIDDVSGGPALWISEASLRDGYEVWSARYGGYDSEVFEVGNCIRQTTDSGYIVASNYWTLIKTDKVGDSLWTRTYEGYPKYVLSTSDSGYLVTGLRDGDLWLLKTDANGDTVTVGVEEQVIDPPVEWSVLSPIGRRIRLRYTNYPQGFHAEVFNATGQKVDELHATGAFGTITWGKGHSPGVYFIRDVWESGVTKKVVLVR
ncbi:hypothetical protein ES703_17035 [subsurface metagenome]|nr:hypothetical protein [bacterium]